MDSLCDLGGGDFDFDLSKSNSKVIDIDGEFTGLSNLGDGNYNAGTGCNGCTGCNVKIEKSKIRETVKSQQLNAANDPYYNRRYGYWDGVGCGGCATLIYLGPPLYYNDWGYNDYYP